MNKKTTTIFFAFLFLSLQAPAQLSSRHNLVFSKLATRWDEAMPLGNGMLGALVWKKNGKLRLSLDRADLWDERKALDLSKFNFAWVEQQVLKKDYAPVQKLGDHPYDRIPYPTKLPAAAMQFDLSPFGELVSNVLDIRTALNTVKFSSGIVFNCYIHASQQTGYFGFENLPASLSGKESLLMPELIVHNYNSGKSTSEKDNSHAGEGLEKLGYAKGTVVQTTSSIRYRQPTYEGHYYEVLVQWKLFGKNKLIGSWTITNNKPAALPVLNTQANEPTGWDSHIRWWKNFWDKSAIQLPDTLIEKQYYLEMYKLGAASRKGAPAITLQAVWTADNGSLPPWKGDFHNDLNTQLSYWPVYSGNHLAEGLSYTDWLWKIRPKNKQYTKQYFGVDGLNVPGVVTLGGDPMGGWIQYSLSPTVVAWCAQHFYWQWKYSMDAQFLKQQAYPYIQEAATYLEKITRLKNGTRSLPLSSSPEYNDNSINAWFTTWTNFDLSLANYLFTIAAKTSEALNKKQEAAHWLSLLLQLPDYEYNETGLTIAPGHNLEHSHRHMSQYMAIYPLALLDANKPADKKIIDNSFKQLEKMGTREWCGYSFSWMASLYARAYQADSAARQLQIFASNFCSPNSFHLNGDQKGGQYSGFTYRPFTLEGNFAFAQGVHELLLQSRDNRIEVFPATPRSWRDVSFTDLRAEGAFLVSGKKADGQVDEIKIVSEKGGITIMKLPFRTMYIAAQKSVKAQNTGDGFIELAFQPGGSIVIKNGYE